jgi:membrane protease YdiL (CAAX protease family)
LGRHPVAAFLALAFLISWGGVLAITLPTGIPGSGEALDRLYGSVFLPMLAGPLLSALIVSAFLGGWAGLKRLLRGFTIWRAKPVEYAASFLLIPACALAVLLTLSAVTPAFTPGFLGPNSGFALIALTLAGGLVVGLIEETGWTGFAVSRLLRGHTVLVVAVGLGLIHGFWHLPVTLWAEGAEFGLVFIPYFLAAWVLAIIVMRILIVWVFARTGSTLLAAVAHASHTGWLFVVWPPATTPVQDVIWTAAFGALGLAAVLSVVSLAPPGDQRTRRTL